MLLRDLTKPLNEVDVFIGHHQLVPAIIFSPTPVNHRTALVQVAVLQVPPRLVYVQADQIRERAVPKPLGRLVKTKQSPKGVSPPRDVLIPPGGVPYLVNVKLKNKATLSVPQLSFLFLHKGEPTWSTPVPLSRELPTPMQRLLIPTSAVITKATPYEGH